jgi:thiol-disulfide isomerase/thioredoxin
VKEQQQSAKTFLPKAILALAIIGLYFFLSESPWAKEHLKLNFQPNIVAKDFTLPIIGAEPGDAGQLSLAELKGSPVVVSFWASWCGVCRGETPQLIEINKELRDYIATNAYRVGKCIANKADYEVCMCL